MDLVDVPPLPYRPNFVWGGLWWDDSTQTLRWQGRLQAGEMHYFGYSLTGPSVCVPPGTVYTNTLTIDDGYHPVFVRRAQVAVEPGPTPVASCTPMATSTPTATVTATMPPTPTPTVPPVLLHRHAADFPSVKREITNWVTVGVASGWLRRLWRSGLMLIPAYPGMTGGHLPVQDRFDTGSLALYCEWLANGFYHISSTAIDSSGRPSRRSASEARASILSWGSRVGDPPTEPAMFSLAVVLRTSAWKF